MNDLDSAGRGKKRVEEGGTRKVGRGELKNEKVAKKRKMKKLLKDASLASLGLVLLETTMHDNPVNGNIV